MERRKKNRPYVIMLLVYLLFIVLAFILDYPIEIAKGLLRIILSRSVLISDYMAIGGIGAALVNSALVGIFSIAILMYTGIRPNGSIVMAMWLSTGFAMFGKNLLNILPIIFGVWLYSKVKKEPLINFSLVFILSTTLSPAVSGIFFHPQLLLYVSIPLGLLVGVGVGFIFSPVSSFTVRVHGGYNLYNMGFAGGLISTFIVLLFAAFDIPMENELEWFTGGNIPLAIMLYVISVGLVLYGLFASGKFKVPSYRKILATSGRSVSDYLLTGGYTAFFNMGLLGVAATTLTLILGADLNGATLCGIFTILGFGAFGKHLRNITPILVGVLICIYVSKWNPNSPASVLAILFSTGLAPIAGQYGWGWGIIAGFLHMSAVMHIGFLNSGLNLYNNGYAAGFVAMLLLPVIMAFQKKGR